MPADTKEHASLLASLADSEGFRLINEITQSINAGSTLDEVFNLIFERLESFVPYNRIAVALVNPEAERLSIIACRSDGKMVLGKGYTGQIAGSSLEPLLREGRPRIINDLQEYLARKPSSESTRLIVREGMRSSLTLPLLVQGKSIGVMFFSSREANVYRPEHEAFLRSIVGHMSVAVERSRLLDALREKGDYLENILQNSADGIVVCDAQNRIQTWNEGARQIFGYESSEVMGKDYSIVLTPEQRQAGELQHLHDRAEREGYLKNYECPRMTKDGRRIIVNLTATLLRDKKGRIVGCSSFIRDVTPMRRLQQDLLNSQSLAAVGELAATVAHEIKNPLAGISGAIQVLAEGMLKSDPRREIIGEVLDQIRRLDTTVRDLLSFARPATPSRQDMNLEEMLSSAWSLLSQQPGAARVRFSIEGAKGVTLPLDSHLMHQVWINLFQNAIEAMPKGGTLQVRVTDGPTVVIEVRDCGNGISPTHLERIFRPFFSTKTQGTGLGLAITKKIIDAHGGTIRAESVPRTRTSFFVEFPR